MNDYEPTDLSDEPTEAEMEALSRLLADPGVWAEPDPLLEDQVVAAIMAEAAAAGPLPPGPTEPSEPAGSGPVFLPAGSPARRPRRTGRRPGWGLVTGAAAAAVLVVVVALVVLRGPEPAVEGRYLELARSDRAPADARGGAQIDERVDGTRILLHVDGLAPAAPGTYYEAWLRKNPQIGVSAGTFHLRGGGAEEIELWAGVSAHDYPLFTVTVQNEAEPASSGKVVLSGRLG